VSARNIAMAALGALGLGAAGLAATPIHRPAPTAATVTAMRVVRSSCISQASTPALPPPVRCAGGKGTHVLAIINAVVADPSSPQTAALRADQSLILTHNEWITAADPSQAAPRDMTSAARPTVDDPVEMSEPMRAALLLAKMTGGGIEFVGSVLATDEARTPDEVAIIQPVPASKMKLGEIVMLARDDCKTPAGCLMARRITDKRGSDLATKHYGHPQFEPGKDVDASLIGRIAYAVDLKTGRIRDMRHDDTKEITLGEALRRESQKWRYVGDHRQPIRYKI
jgi:hypothetical protein